MTNHLLNTWEQPISGGILWSSFAKWSTWNSTYVSVATTSACGPVPALTRVNLAIDTVLHPHMCPHLCSAIHWFVSSHGKPDSRSYKGDSKRKREDTCLWFGLKKLGESYTQGFFSAFCNFCFFCISVSFVIFPKTVVFSPNFQQNSHSDAF